MTITRTAWTDDDGSGTTGTVINNAVKTELYNQIDAAIAAGGAAAEPLVSGSGHVIFPATQISSANVNALDDYEEGTFTPTIAFGGASVGITYGFNQGTYTKIGRLVHCTITFNLTSKGSSTGGMTIEGLPFALSGTGVGHCGYYDNLTGAGMLMVTSNSGTSLGVRYATATGSTGLTHAEVGNTSTLYFTVIYQTAT